MADDVLFLGPGETPFGRDAFPPRFSAAHEQARINCISELQDVCISELQDVCISELQDVAVVGEVAYTLSRDTLSVTPRAGGEEIRFAGYRSTVYRRQPDSRWLLARDTHTLSPVAKLRA